MADELNNENTNECHKHLPKVRVCDIKPSYKFEKKHVTLYDFDEEKVIEEECDELLEQKIRKVCRPQWFLRVNWKPEYKWVRKDVETTEKYWTKKDVRVPVARFCPKKVKKDYEVHELACDWKKVCKTIECKITKETEKEVCGCEEKPEPRPEPQPCRRSYSSRSNSSRGSFRAGHPELPF